MGTAEGEAAGNAAAAGAFSRGHKQHGSSNALNRISASMIASDDMSDEVLGPPRTFASASGEGANPLRSSQVLDRGRPTDAMPVARSAFDTAAPLFSSSEASGRRHGSFAAEGALSSSPLPSAGALLSGSLGGSGCHQHGSSAALVSLSTSVYRQWSNLLVQTPPCFS